jgi:hypothetical protein
LIVLNVAYNAHVFSPDLFTMLVVMALITTMITTPILDLLGIQGSADQSRAFCSHRGGLGQAVMSAVAPLQSRHEETPE